MCLCKLCDEIFLEPFLDWEGEEMCPYCQGHDFKDIPVDDMRGER